MPIVSSLDGKFYDLAPELLEKYRIPDPAVKQLDNMPDLPSAPAPKPLPMFAPPPKQKKIKLTFSS